MANRNALKRLFEKGSARGICPSRIFFSAAPPGGVAARWRGRKRSLGGLRPPHPCMEKLFKQFLKLLCRLPRGGLEGWKPAKILYFPVGCGGLAAAAYRKREIYWGGKASP